MFIPYKKDVGTTWIWFASICKKGTFSNEKTETVKKVVAILHQVIIHK